MQVLDEVHSHYQRNLVYSKSTLDVNNIQKISPPRLGFDEAVRYYSQVKPGITESKNAVNAFSLNPL